MTSTQEPSVGSTLSLSTAVHRCARDFLSLADALKTESRFTTQVSPATVHDELDRFRLWAGNIAAHRKGRRSLEYRLRDAAHLKSETHSRLESLSSVLQNAISIVRGEKTPWDEEAYSDSDSDLSDDETANLNIGNQTELKQLLESAKAIVNSLFRLTIAIRDPAPNDQLRSTITVDKFFFQKYDVDHVKAKFPNCPDWLSDRLGHAISGRRNYLDYCEKHREKLSKNVEKIGFEEPRTELTTNSTEATSYPKLDRTNSIDVLDNDRDDALSQTSYATSINATIRVPALPRDAREKEFFECPLCFMIVSIHTSAGWKQHVYRDLHPYCCTSEHCTTADKLYDSRSTWFSHELEAHRICWQCVEGCGKVFQEQSDFERHVQLEHPDFASSEALSVLRRTSAKSADLSEQAVCTLCDKSMSLRALKKHLGHHQEQLSLFALPPNVDGTEDEFADDAHDLLGVGDDTDEEVSDMSDPHGLKQETENALGELKRILVKIATEKPDLDHVIASVVPQGLRQLDPLEVSTALKQVKQYFDTWIKKQQGQLRSLRVLQMRLRRLMSSTNLTNSDVNEIEELQRRAHEKMDEMEQMLVQQFENFKRQQEILLNSKTPHEGTTMLETDQDDAHTSGPIGEPNDAPSYHFSTDIGEDGRNFQSWNPKRIFEEFMQREPNNEGSSIQPDYNDGKPPVDVERQSIQPLAEQKRLSEKLSLPETSESKSPLENQDQGLMNSLFFSDDLGEHPGRPSDRGISRDQNEDFDASAETELSDPEGYGDEFEETHDPPRTKDHNQHTDEEGSGDETVEGLDLQSRRRIMKSVGGHNFKIAEEGKKSPRERTFDRQEPIADTYRLVNKRLTGEPLLDDIGMQFKISGDEETVESKAFEERHGFEQADNQDSLSLLQKKLAESLHQLQQGFPITCAYCSTIFSGRYAQGNLHRHMRALHLINLDLVCNVPGCDETFSRSDALRKHKMSKHPEAIDRPKIPWLDLQQYGTVGKDFVVYKGRYLDGKCQYQLKHYSSGQLYKDGTWIPEQELNLVQATPGPTEFPPPPPTATKGESDKELSASMLAPSSSKPSIAANSGKAKAEEIPEEEDSVGYLDIPDKYWSVWSEAE